MDSSEKQILFGSILFFLWCSKNSSFNAPEIAIPLILGSFSVRETIILYILAFRICRRPDFTWGELDLWLTDKCLYLSRHQDIRAHLSFIAKSSDNSSLLIRRDTEDISSRTFKNKLLTYRSFQFLFLVYISPIH